MTNLKGLESVVAQLRDQRTGLVNHLKHVDAALSVLGQGERPRNSCETAPDAVGFRPYEDCFRSKSPLGTSESAECGFSPTKASQTNAVSIGASQDRSGSACTMGEGETGGLTP